MSKKDLNFISYASWLISQESAVHGLKTLDILIGMAKKKGRRESIIAVGELQFDLWKLYVFFPLSLIALSCPLYVLLLKSSSFHLYP